MMQNRSTNPTRDGITLALEAGVGHVVATITVFHNGTPQHLHHGVLSLADAFSQAMQASEAAGFRGYYEVVEPDAWPSLPFAEYGRALNEVTRQGAAVVGGAHFWGEQFETNIVSITVAQQ